jgi:hypothetical protein
MTGFLWSPAPVLSLDEYFALGGGEWLEMARSLGSTATIQQISQSGLRGRGGAGFPTAAKWRTVPETRSSVIADLSKRLRWWLGARQSRRVRVGARIGELAAIRRCGRIG